MNVPMVEGVKEGDKVRLLHSDYDENLTPGTPLIAGLEGEVVEIRAYDLPDSGDRYTDYEIRFYKPDDEDYRTWIFYRSEFEVITDGDDT
jgi:hypothetical protein